MSDIKQPCAGVGLRGYRRGFSCGNNGKFAVRGKMYCHAHYTTAIKEPKRFREALEAFVRGEARREAARRFRAAQIDAFPVEPDACCGNCAAGNTADCDINPLKLNHDRPCEYHDHHCIDQLCTCDGDHV